MQISSVPRIFWSLWEISIQSSESQISGVSSCVPDQCIIIIQMDSSGRFAHWCLGGDSCTFLFLGGIPGMVKWCYLNSVRHEFCFRGKGNMWMTKRLQLDHSFSKNVLLSLFLTLHLPSQETTTKQWVCFLQAEIGEMLCGASTKIESCCLKEITLTRTNG